MRRYLKVRLAMKKIRHQFPDTPEGELWFHVLYRTVMDAAGCIEKHFGAKKTRVMRAAANRHLAGDIYAAEICGVNSDWVRRILVKTEVIRGEAS